MVQDVPYIFRYQLDKNSNCLSLFVVLSSNTYIVSDIADELTIVPIQSGANTFFNSSTYFNINYYTNNLTLDLNSTWVSYDTVDINSLKANADKSKTNLTNNVLFTSQYSYVTGNSVDYNFLILKNQFTHKNYSYRSDNVNHEVDENRPPVQNRSYGNVFTGNQQELGDSNITLNYECYNTDYVFKSDQYTIFNTPPSLYPFEQLNINDTLWNKAGAIGGDSPYFSDKLFTKRDQVEYSYKDGQYLCTWLLTENVDTPGVWVDRYYNPQMLSYISALTAGTPTLLDTYNNPVLSAITSELPLSGFTFVDKRSDLVFTPSTEYIYHRIGEKYVDEIVAALAEKIIQDGLQVTNAKGTEIVIEGKLDDKIYNLNNDTYALVSNYKELNNRSQFTLSFWLGADNWQQEFGHQIVGNLTDRGFGVMYDQLVTPFIAVPALTAVYMFNTDFNLIDTVRFESTEFAPASEFNQINDYTTSTTTTAYFVRTLHRTDHLAPVGAIVVPKIQYNQNNLPPPANCLCGVLLTEHYDFLVTESDLKLLIEPCGLNTLPCVVGLTYTNALTTLSGLNYNNIVLNEISTSDTYPTGNIVTDQYPPCGDQYCTNDVQVILTYTVSATTTTTTTMSAGTTPSVGTGTTPTQPPTLPPPTPSPTVTGTTFVPNTTPPPAPPPPVPGCIYVPNDMFAFATPIAGTVYNLTSNTQCATYQSGELVTGANNGSIWFKITPTAGHSNGFISYKFENLQGNSTTFSLLTSVDDTLGNLVSFASGTGIDNGVAGTVTSVTPSSALSAFYVRIATVPITTVNNVTWSVTW